MSMKGHAPFTTEEAKGIGDKLGVDWHKYTVEQFKMGLEIELKHGSGHLDTDVTHDEPILTGKIVLAHLEEYPDYYTRLKKMREEAEQDYHWPELDVREWR